MGSGVEGDCRRRAKALSCCRKKRFALVAALAPLRLCGFA
jgi:hypothetical protein